MDSYSNGYVYCTDYVYSSGRNGTSDGSGCNQYFNSIWSGVFNKRHGRHVSIRWWNCHVGVHSFRNIDGTNNAEYSNFYAVLR